MQQPAPRDITSKRVLVGRVDTLAALLRRRGLWGAGW
jgi:hypothetical protein